MHRVLTVAAKIGQELLKVMNNQCCILEQIDVTPVYVDGQSIRAKILL